MSLNVDLEARGRPIPKQIVMRWRVAPDFSKISGKNGHTKDYYRSFLA